MKYLGKYINRAAIGGLGDFVINPKGLVEGSMAGGHKSPFHGFSVEFAGHREYMPGDDTKHIDWVVYYKRDRYMIKQYEAETNLVCQILLDTSESMRFASEKRMAKMDYAANVAVTLAYLVTGARDQVGLATFDNKITDYRPPSNNLSVCYRLSHMLEQTQPEKKSELGAPLMDFANRIGRRQIVVVLSDFLGDTDSLRRGLARLRYDHHEVVMMHVVDPFELDFPLDGRIKFKGMEGLGEVKLSPKAIRKTYLERFQAHQRHLIEICEKQNAEYVLANTGHSIRELLFQYLTSRLTHLSR